MSTDFSDSMDVTTWTRCCNVTTIMSLFFVHDHTIIDINTANEFQVKEDTDHMIVKGVDSIISNEVGNAAVRKFLDIFYLNALY